MSNKLGALIGKVKHTLSITNDAGDEVKAITIGIDFTNSTDTEITSWLCSNRAITGQRPWRKLSKDELSALNGKTFSASTIGTKVKSKDEQLTNIKNVLRASGLVTEDELDEKAEQIYNNSK